MNIINLIPAISTWPQLWESEHDCPLQCMFVSQACLSVYMILLSNFTRNLITTAIKAPAPGTFNKLENCQCLDNLCLWHLDLQPQPDLCITVYELNKQLDVVSDAGGRSSGWFIIQTQIISSWNLLPAAGLAIPQLLQYSGVDMKSALLMNSVAKTPYTWWRHIDLCAYLWCVICCLDLVGDDLQALLRINWVLTANNAQVWVSKYYLR
jgi:hypothetical protein